MPFAGQAVSAARHPQPAHLGQHCQVIRANTLCKPCPAAHSRAAACLAQLHVLALHLGGCRQCLTGRARQCRLCCAGHFLPGKGQCGRLPLS